MRRGASLALVLGAMFLGCGGGRRTPNTITVTSPNGGETWLVGSTETVLWSSEGFVSDVSIELSADGGTSWSALVASTANDGSEDVTVPDTPSTQCLVRVMEADGEPSDASDGELTVERAPELTVLSPNGAEVWVEGETREIAWSSEGAVEAVDIHYSTDGGSSWQLVASGEANDGSYSWTVPREDSSLCLVRVQEADGDPTDLSDADFTIEYAPAVTVTSPNGSEVWVEGEVHGVTWTSEGTVGAVDVHYSIDGGGTWKEVALAEANDGSYTWTVPREDAALCRVRVQEPDGDPSDMSDASFTIEYASAIGVTAPNGGEFWGIGEPALVTWTSAGVVGNVKIELSTNGGGGWTELVASTANDGSESVTVPDTSSTLCLIRVSETDDSPSDMSDALFTIGSATVAVTSPNGGEDWDTDSSQAITWTSAGFASVHVELSRDNGVGWEDIVASTDAAAGSYSWTATGPGSTECLVRISDENDGSPIDESDAVFTIREVTTISVPASQDVFLGLWVPDTNQNGHAYGLAIDSYSGEEMQALVQFDLSSIPAGATITDATMKLYCHRESSGGGANDTVQVIRCDNSWVETGATWNSDGGNGSVVVTTFLVGDWGNNDLDPPHALDLDITGLVQDWVDAVHPNYGVRLFPNDGMLDTRWVDRENSPNKGVQYVPALEATYTTE